MGKDKKIGFDVKLFIALEKYEKMFGEKAPSFEYDDMVLLPLIEASIKSKKPMEGIEKHIRDEQDIPENIDIDI